MAGVGLPVLSLNMAAKVRRKYHPPETELEYPDPTCGGLERQNPARWASTYEL